MLTVRTVKVLREAGCPLQTLRMAQKYVESVGDSLRDVHLCWDGHELFVVDKWGDVRAAVRNPGQGVLHLVVLPLAAWRTEAKGQEREVDLGRLREHARKRRLRPATSVAHLFASGSAT